MDSERILLNKDDHMLIDLPEMIWEKIFSYVKGPDMLALTEVCQSWNSYITKHRITVKLEQWDKKSKTIYSSEALQVIGKSNREFQNIHIMNYCSENLPFLDQVVALKFKWKSIKITRFYMNQRLLQFIQEHSKHLIELQMIGETTNDVVEHQLIELPKLRVLQMDNYHYSKKTLNSLYFKGLVKLKELILPLKDLNELLNNDESLINFDLCKINLKVARAFTPEIDFNKVAKFLLTQRSMVHIHLEMFLDITKFADVWSKLRYLEYISYGKQKTVLNYSKPKDVSF